MVFLPQVSGLLQNCFFILEHFWLKKSKSVFACNQTCSVRLSFSSDVTMAGV